MQDVVTPNFRSFGIEGPQLCPLNGSRYRSFYMNSRHLIQFDANEAAVGAGELWNRVTA